MITADQVTYKIIAFDDTIGRIQVVYDGIDSIFPVDLHLTVDGLYPTGRELDEYIRMMCPLHIINRKAAIQAGVSNADDIHSLVQDPPASLVFPPSKPLPF